MEQIRIKNLRSLKDTGYIDIKPLTILVGKNSSGKSTLLRFFPLMKQTLSIKKNEPILWYSKNYVDFGSFEESINKDNKDKPMEFDFKFTIEDEEIDIILKITLKSKSLTKIKIEFLNQTILFEEEEGKTYRLLINNQLFKSNYKILKSETFESLIPRFFADYENAEELSFRRRIGFTEHFQSYLYEYLIKDESKKDDEEFQSKMRNDIYKITNELNTSKLHLLSNNDVSFLDEIENDIKIHYLDIFWEEFNEEHNPKGKIIKKRNSIENKAIEKLKEQYLKDHDKVNNLLLGFYIDRIIDRCNEYINSYFSNVHYIAPLRASAQRYYRLQGLAVNEIDPQGENIPMVIHNLNSTEKKQFKRWMQRSFGFEINTQFDSGHVTLNISFNSSENLNLADTGFGFSQILPILLLLWRVEEGMVPIKWENMYNMHNIVIEQPELHLHPALQAKLTDALVKCIAKASSSQIPHLNIILETHSETIINRVGQLIYDDKINRENVNVIIFGELEKGEKNPTNSCIKSVKFNEEGIIEDWPLGFFYPEVL